MNVILSSVKCQSALEYVNDIVVFLKNTNNHVAYLRKVFLFVWDEAVTLKLKSTHSSQRKLTISGTLYNRDDWNSLR